MKKVLGAFLLALALSSAVQAAPTTFNGMTMKARFIDETGNILGGPQFFTAGAGVELTNFASLFDVDFTGNTVSITFVNAASFSLNHGLSFDWTPADGKIIAAPFQSFLPGTDNPADVALIYGNSFGFLTQFWLGGNWAVGDQVLIDVPLDTYTNTAVPEPTSLLLLSSGVGLIGVIRKRAQR